MAIKISGSTIIDDSRNIVNAGVTTVGVLTGTDAKFSGTVEANEFLGTGTKLSGIVTSIVAGSNISVDQSTGQVTITGLANTANVISDTITTGTLNVTGVSTFGNSIDANGDLNISGISTFSSNIDVNGLSSLDDINVSGASTFTGSIDANGTADFDLLVEMDDVNVSSALTSKDINVSSLLTATNINATGIVSSTDGRLIAGVGVQTSGGYIGTGVTTLDFRGNGLSTVTTPSSGFSTVFVDFNGQGAIWSKNESNFTASEGQTTFTKTYTPGYVDVYYNGVRLIDGVNYTATNGTSVGLTTEASVGDKVDIIAYNTDGAAGNYWRLTGDTVHRTSYNDPVAIGTDTQNGDSYLTVGQAGAAGTSLFVYGGARITGILTVGEGSISIDGSSNQIKTPDGTITLDSDGIDTTGAFAGMPVKITSTQLAPNALEPLYVGTGDTSNDLAYFPDYNHTVQMTKPGNSLYICLSGGILNPGPNNSDAISLYFRVMDRTGGTVHATKTVGTSYRGDTLEAFNRSCVLTGINTTHALFQLGGFSRYDFRTPYIDLRNYAPGIIGNGTLGGALNYTFIEFTA